MSLPFARSDAGTLGVELELQCLNTRNYDLSTAHDLLAQLARLPCAGEIKPEITQSMIELNTGVHRRHDTLLANLSALRDVMVEKAELLNVRVAGGGTHPFQMWSDQKIFEGERYEMLWKKFGYLAKQFTVFGQHVHIGCASGDEAIRLLHLMSEHVPAFVALSGASPFYQDRDTRFASSRLTTINAFPLSGTMPFVTSWANFSAYYEQMRQLGVIESMKDFYWDIRPKPEFGTIELRVCDTPLTIEKAAALAAYAQTLAHAMREDPTRQPVEQIYAAYRHNRFNAARYGLSGEWIDVKTGDRGPIGQMICRTIDGLATAADEIGTKAPLEMLYRSASSRRNDADLLRDIYAQTRTFSDVAHRQADIWAHGRAG
ncbi:MAG: YbdK family carboxylate-amine ligase [Burkholderiaceae bacterium]